MGGKGSKSINQRQYSGGSGSNPWNEFDYPQSPSPYSQHHHAPPPPSYGSQTPQRTRRLDRKYSRIADNYRSLDEVTAALSNAGLESSNLIVGIDVTKSNEWTGARSFQRRSLHHIGSEPNPYEQAISIIGKTLSAFDEDNLIPCYGFGDSTTRSRRLQFLSRGSILQWIRGGSITVQRNSSSTSTCRFHVGPTSFAPMIEMGMTIVEQSSGQYHVLLIIADGQVTRSVDTEGGQLSAQEQRTIDAIVKASHYPLSIVLVGVGDGPWDMMREFDDNIPARTFDNFQFVNFTEIMAKNVDSSKKQTEFALSALMEIPSQYKATLELSLLGRRTGDAPDRIPLPPPSYGAASFGRNSKSTTSQLSGFKRKETTAYDNGYSSSPTVAAAQSTSSSDSQICPVCLSNPKNMAFGCGHQTCCDCGQDLQLCPICRSSIKTRIKLY